MDRGKRFDYESLSLHFASRAFFFFFLIAEEECRLCLNRVKSLKSPPTNLVPGAFPLKKGKALGTRLQTDMQVESELL